MIELVFFQGKINAGGDVAHPTPGQLSAASRATVELYHKYAKKVIKI